MGGGVGFDVSEAQACLVAHRHFLLPADPGAELSATSPTPCLPACHHTEKKDALVNEGSNEPGHFQELSKACEFCLCEQASLRG